MEMLKVMLSPFTHGICLTWNAYFPGLTDWMGLPWFYGKTHTKTGELNWPTLHLSLFYETWAESLSWSIKHSWSDFYFYCRVASLTTIWHGSQLGFFRVGANCSSSLSLAARELGASFNNLFPVQASPVYCPFFIALCFALTSKQQSGICTVVFSLCHS